MVRGKEKFLVRWKGYTAGEDTWENRENLENAKEFSQELPREFTAKLLYGWERRRYEREQEKRWDENWYRWKNSLGRGNLKGGPCYESPKQEKVSHAFEH